MIKITRETGGWVIYNDHSVMVEDAADFMADMDDYGIEFEDAMMEFNCMESSKAIEIAQKILEDANFATDFAAAIKGRRI